MTYNDLDTNRSVRRILVKHWIDLGRLSVRSTQGHVLIRGKLLRIHGTESELTSAIVESIFYEIKRLREVNKVTAHLENWVKDGGCWREFERHGARVEDKQSMRSAQKNMTIG